MSTSFQKRTRQQRVATVDLRRSPLKAVLLSLQRGAVLLRLAIVAAAAVFLWALTRGWDPPFNYRLEEIPSRDLIAKVDFEQPDPQATERAREQARKTAIAEYDQDPEPLVQLRGRLRIELGKLLAAKTIEEVDRDLWNAFQPTPAPGTPDPTEEERRQQFDKFRAALTGENALDQFSKLLADALAPFEQQGILKELPPEHDADADVIWVRSKSGGAAVPQVQVKLSDVLLTDDAPARLQQSLNEHMPSSDVSARVLAWLKPRLVSTLTLNVPATRAAQDEAAAAVPLATRPFHAGQHVLAKAGEPFDAETLSLLRLEYDALLAERNWSARVTRSAAIIGMFIGLYTLAGSYLFIREPRVLNDLMRLSVLTGLFTLTVSLAFILNEYAWGSDIIPLLLFAMIIAIAYQQEMALLLAACVTLVIVISLGHGLSQAIVWAATLAGAVLVLRQVRTRSKLLLVGFTAAAVGFLTMLGVGTIYGRPFAELVTNGFIIALWSVIAGSLMTVLLPTVEKVFGVQTDLSLIELGDPAHPLLQELIRRAPGTYNHSITVASLAEAAAEAIGARGLLVRVGAYFHDIGKMLKPGYFVENQGKGDNRHDALVPAMSTLVIIAHVKDGVDLARQNRIPEAIIDFIQQHHGTTLVEYFYRQANQKKAQQDPDSGDLDEASFRYPGPKPQTREASVLMLADAAESASRVLKEPTASRLESLVEDITMKRLLDGQFDECGLTLKEVRKIRESLVKSLAAVYHGRVKYSEQETA